MSTIKVILPEEIRDEMIDLISNKIIDDIKKDIIIDAYDYLDDIIKGNGSTQLFKLTDEEVVKEFRENFVFSETFEETDNSELLRFMKLDKYHELMDIANPLFPQEKA